VERLKIAMLTTTFFPQVGGAEYQVKWLAEELAKRGHEVYLFTPYEAEEFIEKNEKGFPKNIALRKRGANSFSDASRMIYRFAKSIKRIKPDMVHAHYAFSAGFLAVITKPIHKAPVVITSHGEDIQVVKEIEYGMRLKMHRRLLVNLSLKWCDAHVLVSNSMRDAAIDAGSHEDKLYTIHNMFVLPNMKIHEEQIQDVLRKYEIPSNRKILLSVSRLHPTKGLNYLIESMKVVIHTYKNSHLVIAGDGEEREELEKLVNEQGLIDYVTFTGWVEGVEKLALIRSCDVFCLPSLKEGLPITLFEPMYYSKPIVATNVGGVSEVLEESGYIVEKANVDSFSNAILKLLSDSNEREKVGKMANKRLKQFFTDNIVVQYEELFKSLINRKSYLDTVYTGGK
jgi:glycosyltransferase involved in cell wall biosynthesis